MQLTLTEWSFGKAPDLYLLKFHQKNIFRRATKVGLVK